MTAYTILCGYRPERHPWWRCLLEAGHWGWHRPQRVGEPPPTPPKGLSATRRRLSAAVKAQIAVKELQRALKAVMVAHDAAYTKLRGSELTEYARLTA